MIIEFLFDLAAGFVEWIAGLMPDFEPPVWMADPLGPIATALGFMSSFGNWVDFVAIGSILLTAVTVYVIAFGSKFIRALLAHLPFVGGKG